MYLRGIKQWQVDIRRTYQQRNFGTPHNDPLCPLPCQFMHYVEVKLFSFGLEKTSSQFFEYGVMNMVPLLIVRNNYFYALCRKLVSEKCLFHHEFSTKQPDFFVPAGFYDI